MTSTTTTTRRQLSFSTSGSSHSNPIPIPSSSTSTPTMYTNPSTLSSTPRIVRFDSECVLIPDPCAPSSGLKLANLGVMGTRSVALPLWKRGLQLGRGRKGKGGKDKESKDKEKGGLSATSGEEDEDDILGLGYHLHADEDEQGEERNTRVIIRVPIPTFHRHTSQSPTRRPVSASPTITRNIPSCLAHTGRSVSSSHSTLNNLFNTTTTTTLSDEIPVIDALEFVPLSPLSSEPPALGYSHASVSLPSSTKQTDPKSPIKSPRKLTLSPIRRTSSPPTPSTSPPSFSTPAFLGYHPRSSSHSRAQSQSHSSTSDISTTSHTINHYTRRPTDTTIPLRSCCVACNSVMDECVKSVMRGEEWEERFSRGARRRRRSSGAGGGDPLRGIIGGGEGQGGRRAQGVMRGGGGGGGGGSLMGGSMGGGRIWEMSGERKYGFESAVESMMVLPSVFDDEVEGESGVCHDVAVESDMDLHVVHGGDEDPDSPVIPRATFNLTVDEVDKRRKSVDLTTVNPVSIRSSVEEGTSHKTPLRISTAHSPASAGYIFPSKPVGSRVIGSSKVTSKSNTTLSKSTSTTASIPTSTSTTSQKSITSTASTRYTSHSAISTPTTQTLHPYAYIERRASPISEGSEGSVRSCKSASACSNEGDVNIGSSNGNEKTSVKGDMENKRVSSGSYFALRKSSGGSGGNSPLYGATFLDQQLEKSTTRTTEYVKDEEDEAELFPLPSPRRSPRGTPSPARTPSPGGSFAGSVKGGLEVGLKGGLNPGSSPRASPRPSPRGSPKPSLNPSPRVSPGVSPAGSVASLMDSASGGNDKNSRSSSMLNVKAGVYVKRMEVRRVSGGSLGKGGMGMEYAVKPVVVKPVVENTLEADGVGNGLEADVVEFNGSVESLTLLGGDEGLRRKESAFETTLSRGGILPASTSASVLSPVGLSPSALSSVLSPSASTPSTSSSTPTPPITKPRPTVYKSYSMGYVDELLQQKQKAQEAQLGKEKEAEHKANDKQNEKKQKPDHGMHLHIHLPHPHLHFGLGGHHPNDDDAEREGAGLREDVDVGLGGLNDHDWVGLSTLTVDSTSASGSLSPPQTPIVAASAHAPTNLHTPFPTHPHSPVPPPTKRKLSITAGIKRVGGGVLRGVSSIASGGSGVGVGM